MIGRALEVEILRLHHAESWSIGTIARQLHTHHSAVRRVLEQAGVVLPAQLPRGSMIDAYKGFIIETLTRYPGLRASRLYAMARERGYRGSVRSLPPPGGAAATAPGGASLSSAADPAR